MARTQHFTCQRNLMALLSRSISFFKMLVLYRIQLDYTSRKRLNLHRFQLWWGKSTLWKIKHTLFIDAHWCGTASQANLMNIVCRVREHRARFCFVHVTSVNGYVNVSTCVCVWVWMWTCSSQGGNGRMEMKQMDEGRSAKEDYRHVKPSLHS